MKRTAMKDRAANKLVEAGPKAWTAYPRLYEYSLLFVDYESGKHNAVVLTEHQENGRGSWSCDALNKEVSCFTVHNDVKSCGHCLKPVLNEKGEKQSWFIDEHMKLREERDKAVRERSTQ